MAIPRTMKAAVVHKFSEPLVVREVSFPKPGPGKPWWKLSQAEFAKRVRPLRLLSLGLGNPLSGTEKLTLFGGWKLCAVRLGTG